MACIVQNIYLSGAAYGLGGYWTTGGITYLEKAKVHFGLEGPDKLLGFFYFGAIAIPSPMGKRKPIEEKVEWGVYAGKLPVTGQVTLLVKKTGIGFLHLKFFERVEWDKSGKRSSY